MLWKALWLSGLAALVFAATPLYVSSQYFMLYGIDITSTIVAEQSEKRGKAKDAVSFEERLRRSFLPTSLFSDSTPNADTGLAFHSLPASTQTLVLEAIARAEGANAEISMYDSFAEISDAVASARKVSKSTRTIASYAFFIAIILLSLGLLGIAYSHFKEYSNRKK